LKHNQLTKKQIILIISLTSGSYCLLAGVFSQWRVFPIFSPPFEIGGAEVFSAEQTATVYNSTDVASPSPTQVLMAVFNEVDSQLRNALNARMAFNKPNQMKKNETTSMELILSPSMSEPMLAAELAERSELATSTADPNLFIAPGGSSASIATSEIEVTPRMKAVLLAADADAFTVKEMHDSAEQVVSTVDTTAWRWSITARKQGRQTLELIIYQLIKYDGKEFWREVETFRTQIVVTVTISDWLEMLDWKWIASAILIPLAIATWKWWHAGNKREDEKIPPVTKKQRKTTR
jgi:hypothetical protein